MAILADVRERLSRPAMVEKLAHNTRMLAQRVREDGYFAESLTGAYRGMFPRTVGGLARLWLALGRADLVAASLGFIKNVMHERDLGEAPHVIIPAEPPGRALASEVDLVNQIDGQAHVILAWAWLINAGGPAAESAASDWPFFAKLMDRTVSTRYLGRYVRMRVEPGLVLNTNLEHSREWQYWIAYDFLTQAFVAAALEQMIAAAEKLGQPVAADRWRETLAFLNGRIAAKLVREFEGRTIYAEMLLPTGREPVVFDGISWLNLASAPSGWTGVDRAILAATLDAWRRVARIEWDGPAITACEWTPAGHTWHTYGKMLGWDLVLAIEYGLWDVAVGILDFLEQVNTGPLYAEIFRYDPATRQWSLRDAGNGEQVAWLCWSLYRARELCGLAVHC